MDWICGVPGRCFYTVGLYATAGAGRIPARRETKQHPGTTRTACINTDDHQDRRCDLESDREFLATGCTRQCSRGRVYRVEGGTVELYFVDGSQEVRGTGFASEGALFESEP